MIDHKSKYIGITKKTNRDFEMVINDRVRYNFDKFQ